MPPYKKAARVGFPVYHLSCRKVWESGCGCASELRTNFASVLQAFKRNNPAHCVEQMVCRFGLLALHSLLKLALKNVGYDLGPVTLLPPEVKLVEGVLQRRINSRR